MCCGWRFCGSRAGSEVKSSASGGSSACCGSSAAVLEGRKVAFGSGDFAGGPSEGVKLIARDGIGEILCERNIITSDHLG